MAEAAVEERPPQRFYCHMCNVQFQHAASNFTCPHCSDGFIEELHDADDTSNDTGTDIDDWEDEDMAEPDELMRSIFEDRRPTRARSEGGGPLHRTSGGGTGGRRTLTRLASSNLRQNVPSFENFIQDIIINLGVDSIINLGAGNMQLVFGNPGDYAWGREGLDAVVTQLLNQMDSTGPPPLSKAVIEALPMAEITAGQVRAKLQCSVCWEDFVVGEAVKRLPCQHVYHEPCIRPWLELHGTCPICRQNLGGDRGDDDDGPVGGESGSGGTSGASAANALLRSLFGGSPSTSPTPSSSNADSAGRQHRNHNDSMM